MKNANHLKSNALPELWLLLGIPMVFICGSLLHFSYEWSGRLKLVGIFAPVNESVWEHLKLAFWPLVVWWFIGMIITGKKSFVFAVRWLVSNVAAQLACPLVITSFYYTYTGAFGIQSLFLDIFSFLLGLTAGQGLLALHLYQRASFNRYWLGGALVLLLLMTVAFTVFTFDPPHLPLFRDVQTGKYGI